MCYFRHKLFNENDRPGFGGESGSVINPWQRDKSRQRESDAAAQDGVGANRGQAQTQAVLSTPEATKEENERATTVDQDAAVTADQRAEIVKTTSTGRVSRKPMRLIEIMHI